MHVEIRIISNDQHQPLGKLADAEVHFIGGDLGGLKLASFAVWECRDRPGRDVTSPGGHSIKHDDNQNLALLRGIGDSHAGNHIREPVLRAYHQQTLKRDLGDSARTRQETFIDVRKPRLEVARPIDV